MQITWAIVDHLTLSHAALQFWAGSDETALDEMLRAIDTKAASFQGGGTDVSPTKQEQPSLTHPNVPTQAMKQRLLERWSGFGKNAMIICDLTELFDLRWRLPGFAMPCPASRLKAGSFVGKCVHLARPGVPGVVDVQDTTDGRPVTPSHHRPPKHRGLK